MAEEATDTSVESPAESGGEAPELSTARESFSRAAEKSGLSEAAPEGDRGSEGVATREEGDRSGTQTPAREPDWNKANNEWRERREKVRQQRLMEALAKVADRIPAEPQQAAPPPQAPAGPETNPYDRETDYWEWYGWEQENLKKGIVSTLEEKWTPALEFLNALRTQQEQRAQQEQQSYERQEWLREQASIAREAHEVYVGTDEGQGYMDRVAWHVGTPGDPQRGIPPQDGALTIGFIAAGFPEQVAREMAMAHLHGMQMMAMRHGVNPAVAMDRFVRAQIAAAADWLNGMGGNGHGAPVVEPSPPPATATRRRVAGMRQTADAAVAGSVAESGPETGKDLKAYLKAMASRDRLGVSEMKDMARRFGVTPQHLSRMLREEAAKLGVA